MANYQGLDCIMGEITRMVSHARPPHDRHIYEYFYALQKFVRTAVPQLFVDCMAQFEQQLVIEFETYLNGKRIHHDDIEKGISEILRKAIGKAYGNLKINI